MLDQNSAVSAVEKTKIHTTSIARQCVSGRPLTEMSHTGNKLVSYASNYRPLIFLSGEISKMFGC